MLTTATEATHGSMIFSGWWLLWFKKRKMKE
jgi:hypothetical protein